MVARGARSLFLLFLYFAVWNAPRDIVGLNLRRLRHWRDPALALALSCSFALGKPQFDNLTFPLSSLMCRQQKKCSTFQFLSVCFKLFRLFFLFLLVFTFCCWFSCVKLLKVFFCCCEMCYCVFHGSKLFFRTFINCLPMIFDWLVLLPLVLACCNLHRSLIAVCRFISFRIVLGSSSSFRMIGVLLVCLWWIQIFRLYSSI